MADISKIQLPSGSVYNIKDAEARSKIATIESYSEYLGVTSTFLEDNVTTSAIVIINGQSVAAKAGSIVNYGKSEFIYNGSVWQEFGNLSALKALAYKDDVSASYTPTGTVSEPTFTGTQSSISVSGNVAGASAKISVGTGTANYTPSGAVAAPKVTVSTETTKITGITDVGAAPTCTLPSFTTSVSDETLTIGWTAGSFDAGKTATAATAISVVTSASASAEAPTFTGTGVDLEAAVTGGSVTATGSFTPKGSVSTPIFTGTAATITSK